MLTSLVCSIAAAPQFFGQSQSSSSYVNQDGQLITVYQYIDSNGQQVVKEVISGNQPQSQPLQPPPVQPQPIQPFSQPPSPQPVAHPNSIPVQVSKVKPSAVREGAYVHDTSGAYKHDDSGKYRGN